MSSGLFVTGTDTGVGKTVVTCAIAAALATHGLRVAPMKPAETGCRQEGERLIPEDATLLLQVSNARVPLDLVCPYALPEPLAPALAAERAGVCIDLARIVDCYQRLTAEHDMVLVEGAGGLLVPLTQAATMLDLAAQLGTPLLIVAKNVLGVINHTALTVEVARARGVRVLGVVLNDASPVDDLAVQTNAEALRRWVDAPLLAEIPFSPKPDAATLQAAGSRVVTDDFLNALVGM